MPPDLKNFIKYILQKLLGYKSYLFVFARYKINNIHRDKKERDFFKFLDLIKEDGALLDIGANLGIMTVHLSKKFPKRSIHAFEPEPNNVEILNRVIRKYRLNNVKVYPIALGEKKGTLEMVLPKNGKVRMQGLSHVVHQDIKEWNKGEKFSVRSEMLDELELVKVAAIKIDVENFEYYVLKGAEKLLRRDHPIIYAELWNNENRDKTMSLLKELEYSVYFVNDEFELELLDGAPDDKQNFIFLKK